MTESQLQARFDQWAESQRVERSETQMNLGDLISALKDLPPDTPVALGECNSYRGYYSDLAFSPGVSTAKEVLQQAISAIDATFYGYKGGEYIMTLDSPIWVASYGVTGPKLMDIKPDGELVTQEDEW